MFHPDLFHPDLDTRQSNSYPWGMEVHVNDPELQAKINQWVSDTGRSADELVEEAMAEYFDELRQVGETLDRRYDEIRSGRVKLIPGEDVEAYFAAKIAARHAQR